MNDFIIVETLDTYSNIEKLFLKQWINGGSFCSNVRKAYQQQKTYQVLEGMFIKYDSKHKQKIIFRGLKFNKNSLQEKQLYEKLINHFYDALNNDLNIKIDFAPSSFSLKKGVAQKFASQSNNEYKSIIFIINNRLLNEVDACSKEAALKNIYTQEAELILQTHKIIFKVIDIIENSDIIEIAIKEAI